MLYSVWNDIFDNWGKWEWAFFTSPPIDLVKLKILSSKIQSIIYVQHSMILSEIMSEITAYDGNVGGKRGRSLDRT